MFENEIKFINDFTLNKIKEVGSFITIEKFLSTDIHPAIKKYVGGEIDYLIFEDRKKLIENSLFDYSGKEIANYFDLIADEIKKTKKISYEDIKNIVLQAVSFNANYVVRPKWSLSKLIFGNNKTVSVNELRLMLNYTYYYEYLNNVFLAYLSKKKIQNISVTEFELIVNKIDRELFMLHQSKLVDNALYAIADYFSIGGLNKSSVSIEAVENFLKEKNLTELLFKLKRTYSDSYKRKADIDDIRKVLYSTLSIDSPFVEENNIDEPIVDEKHFENPIKTVDFITTAGLAEIEESDDNEKDVDLNFDNEPQVFVAEEKELELPKIEELRTEEKPLTEIEEAAKLNEPEEFEIPEEQIISETIELIETKELEVPNEELVEKSAEEFQNFEDLKDVSSENKESNLVKEEDVLTSLTDEIEKEKDDEIIILDDKEQEDLLNFYDNELEISIDDDLSVSDNKKGEIQIDSELEIGMTELEFEHEPLKKSNEDEEVSLENLEFSKDFKDDNNTDTNLKESETGNLGNSSQQSKTKKGTEDIFSFLSRKEIDRIIKNVFNSDSEDFANTIEKMVTCNTFEEANLILENLFKYARIRAHTKEATSLTNAVARYFDMEK
jgi:hypothetical protein